ncbi:MAG TPA: hypothetical protein VFJ79_08215 [Acidimicrobiales bacterium]|nr:hypothetical protein [Acidimicrobiales bacterium]
MSDLWLLPLGIGAGGAVLLALTIKRLNADLAALKESMRPLRVEARRSRGNSGTGAGTL